MTNILATISFVVVTNWSPSFYIDIEPYAPYQKEVKYIEYQIGQAVTNTMATIVWHGKTNELLLESSYSWKNNSLLRRGFTTNKTENGIEVKIFTELK